MSGQKCGDYSLSYELNSKREEENRRRRIERNVKDNLKKIELLLQKLEKMPHDKFTPGEFKQIASEFENYKYLAKKSRFQEIVSKVSQLAVNAERLVTKIQTKEFRWGQEKEKSGHDIEKAKSIISSTNFEFLDKWHGTHVSKDSFIEQFKVAAQAFESEDFSSVKSICDRIVTELESIKTKASRNEENYRERLLVQEKLEKALRKMNFQIYESDKPVNPAVDPLIVEATTGMYDIDIRLNSDRTVNINTPDDTINDTTLGADCHKDVTKLLEGLHEQGVELKITDWGKKGKPVRIGEDAKEWPVGDGTKPTPQKGYRNNES